MLETTSFPYFYQNSFYKDHHPNFTIIICFSDFLSHFWEIALKQVTLHSDFYGIPDLAYKNRTKLSVK